MRRVILILVVMIGLLGLAGWAYVELDGRKAAARGARRYIYRKWLKRQVAEAQALRPAVVWMGDSTILGARHTSYPQILRGVLPNEQSSIIGFLGADFFTYYPLVASLLEVHRPSVIVLVAHLRLFRPMPGASRNDLLSMLPAGELPRAVALPLAARGLSVPGLLLVRLLRYDAVEHALYVVEGARLHLADARIPWLGPNSVTPGGGLNTLGRAIAASDVGVGPANPTVRMMRATVRLAREAGVRVIVVGTPVPFEAMRQSRIGYDPARYASRYAALRRAVEESGGLYVDLHEALPAERFADAVGHFDAAGAKLLADRLRPIVSREMVRAQLESRIAETMRAPKATSGPSP